MALAARLADDEVRLVDGVSLDSPKTATMARLMKALGLTEQTVLFSPEKHDGNLWKSARNISGMSVAPVGELNAWSILRPRAIVMTKAAIDAFRATAVAAKPAKSSRSKASVGKASAKKAAPKRTRAAKEK